MNLPNKLTMSRIIAVPFFCAAFISGSYFAALIIFILASITDSLDGKIARKYNLVTNFGKIMDPLADKILVYAAMVLLTVDLSALSADWGIQAYFMPFPAWMLIVILAREFLIAGMRTVAASEGVVIAAGMSGKIKTVLQMCAVISWLIFYSMDNDGGWILRRLFFALSPEDDSLLWIFFMLSVALTWAALIAAVYSGIEYVVKNKEVFKH